MDLDKIDKQIIFELSNNARQSYKQISKKIKVKKDTIAYRINRLEQKGVITKYVPVFSLSKMEIYLGKIYLKFHGLSSEKKDEIINSLIKNESISWVANAFGNWDLMIALYIKNIVELSNKRNEILAEFSDFVDDYDVVLLEDALIFNRDYLLETQVGYRDEFLFGGDTKKVCLDETDEKIIQLIRNDGRFEYHKISNLLNLDSRTIQNKIKKLESKGVLQGYTCVLDIKKLGYQLHKLCISLKDHKKESIDLLISYLKQQPNIIHLIKCLGSWELEVEIEADKINVAYDYISDLKNKFPKIIKRVQLATITDELKIEFYPEYNDL